MFINLVSFLLCSHRLPKVGALNRGEAQKRSVEAAEACEAGDCAELVADGDESPAKKSKPLGIERTQCENAHRMAVEKLKAFELELKEDLAANKKQLLEIHGGSAGVLTGGPLQQLQELEASANTATTELSRVLSENLQPMVTTIASAPGAPEVKELQLTVARRQQTTFTLRAMLGLYSYIHVYMYISNKRI